VQSDAELSEFVRATAETEYHPVGTCKMGNDPMAAERLRIIDASIMLTVVRGNTSAPAIMIAEKGSDVVLSVAAGN
jgi:choline dehydrogenase-like flavoprotein